MTFYVFLSCCTRFPEQCAKLAQNCIIFSAKLIFFSGGKPPWVGAMSTGDAYGHRQGRKRRVLRSSVAPAPGLLVYWTSWLKALAVKLSRPSGRSGSYTGLIGLNPRQLKGLTDIVVYAKSSLVWSQCKIWLLFLIPCAMGTRPLGQRMSLSPVLPWCHSRSSEPTRIDRLPMTSYQWFLSKFSVFPHPYI